MAFSATAASAADINKAVPRSAQAAAFNWSGFYGGVSAGWSRSEAKTDYSYFNRAWEPIPANFPGTTCNDAGGCSGGSGGSGSWGDIDTDYEIINPGNFFDSVSSTQNSFAGGLHLGYNWQPSRNFVFGIEGDFTWLSSRNQTGSASNQIVGDAYWQCDGCEPGSYSGSGSSYTTYDWYSVGEGQNSTSTKVEQRWLSTLRARAGGLVTDRLMVFGTGGLAFADVKVATKNTRSYTLEVDSDTHSTVGTPGGTPYDSQLYGTTTQTWSDETDQNRFGYAIGGGMEYALTDNWLIRGEYIYYNLGTIRQNLRQTTSESLALTNYAGFSPINYDIEAKTKIDGQIVRAAVLYKF